MLIMNLYLDFFLISVFAVSCRAWFSGPLPPTKVMSHPSTTTTASSWATKKPQEVVRIKPTTAGSPFLRCSTQLKDIEQSYQDSPDAARPLQLSKEDLKRLSEMQNRRLTIPLVILDAVLPGQTLNFQR